MNTIKKRQEEECAKVKDLQIFITCNARWNDETVLLKTSCNSEPIAEHPLVLAAMEYQVKKIAFESTTPKEFHEVLSERPEPMYLKALVFEALYFKLHNSDLRGWKHYRTKYRSSVPTYPPEEIMKPRQKLLEDIGSPKGWPDCKNPKAKICLEVASVKA